jgi:hypothetical protein
MADLDFCLLYAECIIELAFSAEQETTPLLVQTEGTWSSIWFILCHPFVGV